MTENMRLQKIINLNQKPYKVLMHIEDLKAQYFSLISSRSSFHEFEHN